MDIQSNKPFTKCDEAFHRIAGPYPHLSQLSSCEGCASSSRLFLDTAGGEAELLCLFE